ncbi:retinol dehydrogenase 12-like isoform X2 [Lycorma delicatula]|uniref:retinol dehydrogenase 12-like isoform X2 n=1 Tax=Lycorma delicatula TaxID=130591 RepID=UPI003F5160CF
MSLHYYKRRYFRGEICACQERLDGKVVIVTGANSGIGKETSFILARKGATVILACRNEVEGQRVAKDIYYSTGNSFIKCEYLDLTSFESIQLFVDRLKKSGIHSVYALINNAGIFYHPFKLTEGGFEITFQTNYLGPFFLTILLININLLKHKSRIVNVVSEAHRFPKQLVVDEVCLPRPELNKFIRYGESKLCLVLFSNKLASHLKGIAVFNVDPGNVETNVYRHFPLLNNKFLFALQKPIRWFLVKTPVQGAQTIIHVVSSSSCSEYSGSYFSDCKVKTPSDLALDKNLANNLFNNSLKWCGLMLNVDNKNVQETTV